MNQHSDDPELRAQIEDEAERRRAIETIEHFDRSLLDAIRRYDVKAIARILDKNNGKHLMGAAALATLLTNLYIFHRNSDVPATIWSVIKLGLMSFFSSVIPMIIYILISTSSDIDNPFFGSDEYVKPSHRLRGFLLILCACFGISSLFVFGILA